MNRATIRLAIFALSMPFVAVTVKAEDGLSEFPKLIQAVMASGVDFEYRNGFAQAVSLDKPMSAKVVISLIDREARKVHVIYEKDETESLRPFCIFLVRSKKTQHDVQERFFRVSLEGQLEKVITLRNKLDDRGKNIREGRSKVEEDMNSPVIQRLFKTDLKFWLTDWLKKQQKSAAKTTAK